MYVQLDPTSYTTDISAVTGRAVDTLGWHDILLVADYDSVSSGPVTVLLEGADTQTGTYSAISGAEISIATAANAFVVYGHLRTGNSSSSRWVRARIEAAGSTMIGSAFIIGLNPKSPEDMVDAISPVFTVGTGE